MSQSTTAPRVGREMKNQKRIPADQDMKGVVDALNERDAEITQFAEKTVQTVTEHNARLLEVEQKLARRGGGGNAVEDQSGLEQAYKGLVQSDGLKAMREEGATSSGRIVLDVGLKALTSLQGSPAATPVGIDVAPQRAGMVAPVQRPLRILEVLPSRPVTSNTFEAPLIDAASLTQADYQEGEGTEKPEGVFSVVPATFAIATIAEHITVSKQVLDDERTLLGTIDRLLRYDVMRKADTELVDGDGAKFHIKGLTEYTTPFVGSPGLAPADRIGEAMAAHQNAGFMPNVVLVNPMDWFKMSSERSEETGEYVAGGWDKPAVPTVWNTRVIPASTVAQGTALVLDTAWLEVLDRQQVTVLISDQHDKNFTTNKVTILAEMRLGLYVANTAAIVEVTLS